MFLGGAFLILGLTQLTHHSKSIFNSPLSLASFSEELIVLTNERGMEVHILTIGAVIQRLLVPDKAGELADVVLGFDNVQPYKDGTSPYFGAVVGRVANRIALGKFKVDGQTYNLSINDPPNSLHGGTWGWSRKSWEILRRETFDDNASSVTLGYNSPDGDEGYPGAVNATVTYTLTSKMTLEIEFAARSSALTPINMAQHTYFNLDGVHKPATILQHTIRINSTSVTPVDATRIPTGSLDPVEGTAYDFRQARQIGERIKAVTGPPPVGYDINYVLWGRDAESLILQTANCSALPNPGSAARVHSPASGRLLEVVTTAPGLQFYSGNFLDGSLKGKGNVAYPQYGGFALETQNFPNFVNQPKFPQCWLAPGETYRAIESWRFAVQ